MIINNILKYKYPIICFLGIAILHLSKLNIFLGYFILVLVLVCSSINALAFIVTGVGSQLLTNPLGLEIQFTQLQIIFFLLFFVFKFKSYVLVKSSFLIKIFIISILGSVITLLNNTFELFIPVLTGLCYLVILIIQFTNCKYSPNTLFSVFVISTLLSGIGFWSFLFDIETVSMAYEASSIRNIIRMGSGNVDANSVGITIPIGFLGLNALLLSKKKDVLKSNKMTYLAVIFTFIYCIPVVLSTGSRTSIIILVLGYLILLLGSLKLKRKYFQVKTAKLFKTISWKFYLLIAMVGLVFVLLNESAQKVFLALEKISQFENNNLSMGFVSGRSALWLDFGKVILTHPLFGCPSSLKMYVTGLGEINNGEYQAHNTYLEIASLLGIPLAILYLSLFFTPIFTIYKRYKLSKAFPIYVVYVVFFIAFFSISAHSWKTFYIFLALLWLIVYRKNRLNEIF